MITREQLHEILEGDSHQAHMYGRTMTVLIILSLVPLCFKEIPGWLEIVEWICVSIFMLDYLARWSCADLKLGMGKRSFLVYPITPMAIIDLVSILPSFIALNPAWRSLRAVRLFRVLRAFRLIRYSKNINAISQVFIKNKTSLIVVVGLAVAYVLISALIIFQVEPDTFNTFFDAVYWAMVSLTTVGYGDLYPTTVVGRTIAMISSFTGIAVVALPAGIITAGLLDELRAKDEAKKNPHPQEDPDLD
ncbi:MAG: ion transporter [Eggerthellaceae bacterium]|nr:ion transporter [Eggerthellaceae bacterium]